MTLSRNAASLPSPPTGKLEGQIIGLKSNRDAALALPAVTLRETQLRQLVEINRERGKEKERLKELMVEREEEEEEARWVAQQAERRKEKGQVTMVQNSLLSQRLTIHFYMCPRSE